MNFKTIHQMIAYIENNTEMTVIKKTELPKSKENIFWIYTQQGNITLNANGYFAKYQIIDKLKEMFDNLERTNVIGELTKKFYSLITNCINNS